MKVSREDARNLLVDAVRISSPSGHEQEVARLLADRMEAFNLSSHIDEMGNVIGEIGDTHGPTILLLGHIDTITTLLPVIDTEDRLLGRGSVDAKGALCCFICAAAAMVSAPCKFIVIGAVGEEADSRGARSLEGKYEPSAVIVGEPSAADAIVIGYKGKIGGVYTRLCQPGHIAGPGTNAAIDASQFWRTIEAYLRDQPIGGGMFERAEPSISRISGDAIMAELHFDVRIPVGFDISGFLNYAANKSGSGFLRIDEAISAVEFSRSSPPARALIASLRAASQDPKIKVKTGTCDMNVVSRFWDAPMVAYGPGDSKLDHSLEENLPYAEYFKAIEILSDALRRLSAELIADQPISELQSTWRR
ncbi:M20/M25/M40 family metallo-hydrolase [Consotaella aegiceratis]|uniref:M20/M25/M40 family metallo-hydrolase n=1 Tax=Consotaella aegiceratis TaxID=3097961 RepID=UPI002F3FBCDC